jgi:hypothetical protein
MKVNKCSEFYPKKKMMYVVVYKNSHCTKNRWCFAKLDQGKGFLTTYHWALSVDINARVKMLTICEATS